MIAGLKPCPFCGETETVILNGPVEDDWCAVACDKCHAIGPTNYTDPHAVSDWNCRTDLSQASVAAALEAAAGKARLQADGWKVAWETAKANKNPKEARDWQSMMLAGLFVEDSIRALITDHDRDALAAHVAAEVAKVRAEDAAWQPIETAPKDGTMLLVCLPRMMKLIVRARFNTTHNYWMTDYEGEGGITKPHFLHPGDLWKPMPDTSALAQIGAKP